MNIESDREKTICRYETDDKKASYSIRLAKKNQDGSYTSGFIPCRFKKDIEIPNKQKIKIKKAWIDFYVKDKKTYPYIFINEFDLVDIPQNVKTDYEDSIKLDDKDLPF